MLLKSIKDLPSHDYLNMPPISRRLRHQHLRNMHNHSISGQLCYSVQLHLARCFLYCHTASKKNWDYHIPDVLPSDTEFLFPFTTDSGVRYKQRHHSTSAYPFISFANSLESIRSHRLYFPNSSHCLVYRHLLRNEDIEDYLEAYRIC